MADSAEQLALALPIPEPSVVLPSLEALGVVDGASSTSLAKVQHLDQYVLAASRAASTEGMLSKALTAPPSAFSFATMSYMPDPQAGGLISWPGIPPESIQRLARTNIAPEMIVGQRVVDIGRYSNHSSHPWRPGWRLELREAGKTPSAAERRDIQSARTFIENCNAELDSYKARERDAAGYSPFGTFLARTVRDFLLYDAMAIWTDMDRGNRVRAWNSMPAGNVRLADPQVGYRGNPEHFAVLVDQGGAVKRPFTREELVWYVGHPRTDPDVGNYGWCYASDTEVLTSSGWKTFDKVDLAIDLAATINTSTGNLEWQIPQAVTWQPYTGEVYHIKSRTLDLVVTPNHRIITQSDWAVKCSANPWRYEEHTAEELYQIQEIAGKMPSTYVIPAISKWSGVELNAKKFDLPNNPNTKIIEMSGDDYCALLGAYLSEGYVPDGPNRNNTYICQRTYSKGFYPYKELLDRIDGREVYYDGEEFVLCGAALAKHLSQFGSSCYTKHIPQDIMNATPKQINIFLEYFILGDGSKRSITSNSGRNSLFGGESISVTTTSKKLADQLQELAQKAGFSAAIRTREGGFTKAFKHAQVRKSGKVVEYSYESNISTSYVISFRGAKTQHFSMEKLEYNGQIGCLTVPNGTLYVRRNGKPAWSGNSRIEVGMRLIEGFQNAIDMNIDTFSKSSFPMGMMVFQGAGLTQNELDLLTRQWQNLKKGASKVWALPFLAISRDSKVEFINLSAAHGQDAMYVHHMNLVHGVFCAVMMFPHRRFGWHLSGTARDSEPLEVRMKQPDPTVEEDAGLTWLLDELEKVINPYILWTRYPHLQLRFCGKSPREDAREYEAKQLARTYGERRAEVDLPPLVKLLPAEYREELEPYAELLELCPSDPGMMGVFQALLNALVKPPSGGGGFGPGGSDGGGGDGAPSKPPAGGQAHPSATGGAIFPAVRDPAKALDHGAEAGVRRHGGRGDSRKRESVL